MSQDDKGINNRPNAVKEITEDGSFNRQKNRFTTPFGQNEGIGLSIFLIYGAI
jgi:putative glutathione S-transferase